MILRLAVLFTGYIASACGSAASFVRTDLPWQTPCDKHSLCRRMVQERAHAAARCSADPHCSSPAGVDCFAGEAFLLPFRCAPSECVEVAAFADSIKECESWFPPLGVDARRRTAHALLAAAVNASVDETAFPAAAAAVQDYKAMAKKGGKKKK